MNPGLIESNMPKQLVIISKFFLPQVSADSNSVYQMISEILKIDSTIRIQVVTTDTSYKIALEDKSSVRKVVLDQITIHRVLVQGSKSASSLKEMYSNLTLGYKLVKKAKSLGVKDIISLSNPPLIAMWCSLLLRKFNFFYWTFDLFPDAFAAEELIPKNNLLFKQIERITYRNPPSAVICLGDRQYSYVAEKFNSPISYIKLPCGVHDHEISKTIKPSWHKDGEIFVGYIGNIGRAHSLPFLLNVISEIASKPGITLILSAYGYHKEAVMSYLEENEAENILIVDFVDKSMLGYIDIHLVSLKETWKNISVPSKAVSAVCSGSVLWFCGPEDSDTGEMFRECSYVSDDDLDSVRDTLYKISMDDILNKKIKSLGIRDALIEDENSAYKAIISMINT